MISNKRMLKNFWNGFDGLGPIIIILVVWFGVMIMVAMI